MSRSFEKQLTVMLKHEGAFREDGGFQRWSADRGNWLNGELIGTKYGITAGRLAQWRGKRHVTVSDVKNMSLDEAKQIYRHYYFDAPKIELLPDPIEGKVFDMAVNHGPVGGVRILQKVLNKAGFKCDVDGKIGPETTRQAFACWRKMGAYMINALVDERNNFYHAIVRGRPSQGKFLRGWLRRSESFRVDPTKWQPEIIDEPPPVVVVAEKPEIEKIEATAEKAEPKKEVENVELDNWFARAARAAWGIVEKYFGQSRGA